MKQQGLLSCVTLGVYNFKPHESVKGKLIIEVWVPQEEVSCFPLNASQILFTKCTVSYTGFNMSDETPFRVNNNLCSPFRSMWGKVNSIASKNEYYHTRLNEKASRVQKQTPCIISNQAVSCAQSRSSLMRPNSHYHLLLNTTTSCPAANLLRLLLLLWALLKMNF